MLSSDRKMRPVLAAGRREERKCEEMWTGERRAVIARLSHHEVSLSPPSNLPTRPGPGGNMWALLLSVWRHGAHLWRDRPGAALLIIIISASCCHLLHSVRLGVSTYQNECVQRPRRHERIQACCHYAQHDVYCFHPFSNWVERSRDIDNKK